jgi:ribosomal protein S18 acetylase RimI-like enzyme
MSVAMEEPSGEPTAFDLRPARMSDYGFVESLYLQTMQPLLVQLGAWDQDEVIARFKQHLRVKEVQIIAMNGEDAGFLQVVESAADITLAQIHLRAAFRRLGIGTRLILELLDRARASHRPVVLSVVRNNPALALYQRLGFTVTGEDETKFHMRWLPAGMTARISG